MRRLHSFQLSPFCRKVRLVLGEKKLAFESIAERPWEPRADLMPLDPSGQLPVLIEEEGFALSDAQAIVEYVEELHPEPRADAETAGGPRRGPPPGSTASFSPKSPPSSRARNC